MSAALFSLQVAGLEHGWAIGQLVLGDHTWVIDASDACNCPYTDLLEAWLVLSQVPSGVCVVTFFIEPGTMDLTLERVGERVVLSFEGTSRTVAWVAFQQSLYSTLHRFLSLHTGVAEDHLWTWPFPFENYHLLQTAVAAHAGDDR